MIRSISLLLAIAIATPALAGDPQPVAKSAAPKPVDNNAPVEDKLICERQEVIGSRLVSRKVCHTAAEWAEIRLQDRQGVEQVQISRGKGSE